MNINYLMNINKEYIMYELENKASSILREEYLQEEKFIETIAQIIHEPSFEDKVSFEFFK